MPKPKDKSVLLRNSSLIDEIKNGGFIDKFKK
jgi:hypothetical protein